MRRSADNHTGKRRPRVRAAAACARPKCAATTRSPARSHRSPPVTSAHAHATDKNQPPPPVCTFLLPLSCSSSSSDQENRVLETIEIAHPTPQIVQRRRLLELLLLFPARRVDRFADRAALLFLLAGEAAAAFPSWIGSRLAC